MNTLILLAVIASASAHLRDHAHEKYVGTALSPDHFATNPRYKQVAAQEFNCLTAEYQMKWDPIEADRGHPDYKAAEKILAFANENKMKVRGHALIWHVAVPKWVKALQNNKTELHNVMVEHIKSTTKHFKGRLYCWDVVNEVIEDDGSMRQTMWFENFGTGFISEAFHLAHSIDPTAKLYINDYNIEHKNKKSDTLYELVRKLKSEGVPIQGVGFQAHFELGKIPADFQSNVQRFVDLGVEVAFTEVDIKMHLPATQARLDQQAKDYEHVFNVCRSIHKCVGVTVWGFTDKFSWIPGFFKGFGAALPFDADYNPKPAAKAIEKVLT